MNHPTITKTRKVFFNEVPNGQNFYTIKNGNEEIDREFVKTGYNTAKIINYPMSNSIILPVDRDCVVLVDLH